VGRATLFYEDAERTRWAGDGPRPLRTTVWYPAERPATETEWTVGVFRAGRTAVDAEIGGPMGPLPLVVLSHGTGGAAAQLSWLAEHLAAHGYLVAAVNHHGNTAAEAAYLSHGFALWWERPTTSPP
jgi:predicted dienelactone hydrolase